MPRSSSIPRWIVALAFALVVGGGGVPLPVRAQEQDVVCTACAGHARVGCGNCDPNQLGKCGACRGSGQKQTDASACASCYGSGTCQGCQGAGLECAVCGGHGRVPAGAAPAPGGPSAPGAAGDAQTAAEIERALKPLRALVGACTVRGAEGERTYTGEARFTSVGAGTWLMFTWNTTDADGATDAGGSSLTYDVKERTYTLHAFTSPGTVFSVQGVPQKDGGIVFGLGQGVRIVWKVAGKVLRSTIEREQEDGTWSESAWEEVERKRP